MGQFNFVVKIYAYISAAWVELNDVSPSKMLWGMPGNSPLDRLAGTGEITFALDNSTGLYTPGGPSMLTGWKRGLPIKLVVSFEKELFAYRFYISDIRIRPNSKDKKAYVTALDWMDYAGRHPIVNPGVQTSKRGDQVLTTLMGEIEIQPQASSFNTGVETFPTAFDTVTSHTKAYNEFAKVGLSELGYVYLKKDRTNGETLVFEAADARPGWRPVDTDTMTTYEVVPNPGFLIKSDNFYLLKESDGGRIILDERITNNYTFDGTLDGSMITDFEAPYGEHVINRMTVYANPRRLSASPEILFQLDKEIVVGSGQTVQIKGTYADPKGGLPINGQSMVTPVITTDYTMFTATGGGGSNISSDLVIVTGYGTEGFTHSVTNNNASVGYINKFNCRGTGIYIYNPIEHMATDAASIAEYGTESESLNQKYKNDLYSGSLFVESVVDEFAQPRTTLDSISFCANKSEICMMAFLFTDIGDLRYISIPEAGIAGNYYIQGIEVEMKGNIIMVTWITKVVLSLLVGLSPIAGEFAGGTAVDAIDFGYQPKATNLSEISVSAWIYQDTDPAINVNYAVLGMNTDYGGWYLATQQNKNVVFYQKGTPGNNGKWSSPDNAFSLSSWTHILITRVNSGPTSQPIIYVNGSAVTVTEDIAQIGSNPTEISAKIVVGNANTKFLVYTWPFDGKIYDPRIYNRILSSAEATTLYNSGTPDETLVTSGLVFQGMNVRTDNLTDYVDQTLTSADKVRDNIYGAVGTPHGAPIGRAAP